MLLSLPAAEAVSAPKNFLWAWQRNEYLDYIEPSEFGVAYLACTATVIADRVHYEWRNQTLKLPPDTCVMPVLRINVDHRSAPAFSEKQVMSLVSTLSRISTSSPAAKIQIDFDALQTERGFYADILTKAREKLPREISLSITALASWCLFDSWIRDLPVEETVPMMFSLGKERSKILSFFKSNRDFIFAGCCKSLGLSIEDSETADLMIGRARERKIPLRVYFFTRTPWTEKKLEIAKRMLENREK